MENKARKQKRNEEWVRGETKWKDVNPINPKVYKRKIYPFDFGYCSSYPIHCTISGTCLLYMSLIECLPVCVLFAFSNISLVPLFFPTSPLHHPQFLPSKNPLLYPILFNQLTKPKQTTWFCLKSPLHLCLENPSHILIFCHSESMK